MTDDHSDQSHHQEPAERGHGKSSVDPSPTSGLHPEQDSLEYVAAGHESFGVVDDNLETHAPLDLDALANRHLEGDEDPGTQPLLLLPGGTVFGAGALLGTTPVLVHAARAEWLPHALGLAHLDGGDAVWAAAEHAQIEPVPPTGAPLDPITCQLEHDVLAGARVDVADTLWAAFGGHQPEAELNSIEKLERLTATVRDDFTRSVIDAALASARAAGT